MMANTSNPKCLDAQETIRRCLEAIDERCRGVGCEAFADSRVFLVGTRMQQWGGAGLRLYAIHGPGQMGSQPGPGVFDCAAHDVWLVCIAWC